MMKGLGKWICAAALMGSAVSGHALVIDFNALAPASSVSSFTTQGFSVSNVPVPGSLAFISSGGSSFCGPPCPENGTNHLLNLGGGWRFSESGNTPFTLASFDGAEAHQDRQSLWARDILVTGTLAGGGTVSASFALDFIQDGDGPLNDFQTFLLPSSFTNLLSVEFKGINGSSSNWFSMDNVNVAAGRPVPVPATALLLAAGLAGLAGLRRRKG